MNGLALWTIFGVIEVYLLLAATLGVRCYHKGYTVLTIAGAVLPMLWIIGACLRARPNSYYRQTQEPPARTESQQAERLVASGLQTTKWDRDRSPNYGPRDLSRTPYSPDASSTSDWPGALAAPLGENERVYQRLRFLRWLVETGRLEP